jgi:preprotein translocase subunit SecY
MWMGEQITEFGIGNGISIILFAGIVARVPNSMITTVRNVKFGKKRPSSTGCAAC